MKGGMTMTANLTEVNQITLESGDFGTYLIKSDDGRDLLVQADWDFPATARTFGWNMEDVQKRQEDEDGNELPAVHCEHAGTDGTVTCPGCGLTATEFISAAANWLDENEGATAEDPGYFS
jgi:hypothetical protein